MKKTVKTLTSENLKTQLWETLIAVKTKRINPETANAVASQSREIMRVVKTELTALKMAGVKPDRAILGFSGK